MKKRFRLFFVLLCTFTVAAHGSVYFVAPTGNDANTGTIDSPFLTIQRAQTAVVAGDTVYVRGGTYGMQESQIATYSSIWAYVTYLTKSGIAGKRINYWAYPGERPVFDYSNVKPANYRINAFEITGSYLHIKGLEVVGVQVTITTGNTQSICFSQSGGSYNIFEELRMHDGMAIGYYLTRGGNNLILNCDAYNNWDNVSADQLGGNVDGFGCHPNKDGLGYTGNVFRGCRAWLNSDDGYDCINAFEAVTFENCWSFYNGYSKTFQSLANGLGFKAGGYGVSTTPTVPAVIPHHVVRGCVAVRNKADGFYANHHLGGISFYNNTAYYNATNYNMLNRNPNYLSDAPGYGHVIQNNVSYAPRSANSHITNYDAAQCTIDHNSFLNAAVSVTSADFVSIDTSLLRAPRRADGSLPATNFMRLAAGSDLVDAGADVGLPFFGAAPDLGAFEWVPYALPVQLQSFTASVVNGAVRLQWKTAGETGNSGWWVERLPASGNVWETAGFVNGQGTTTETTTYAFTDQNTGTGKFQYRLRQLDRNGNSRLSDVRVVDLGRPSLCLDVYPVPVSPVSVIRYSVPQRSKVVIALFHASGQFIRTLVSRESEAGQYQLSLKGTHLPAGGPCFLRLSAGGEAVTKMIF